jgi:CheY-specific phosphatase CheX
MSEVSQLLGAVVAETLEQFAFLFGEQEDPEGAQPEPRAYLQATIHFDGGGDQGTLRIATTEDLCREMAANILGLDPDEIPGDATEDAIKELANVLVGTLTVRRLGVNVPCALDTPQAQSLTATQMKALMKEQGSLCFNVEEHLFVAVLNEKIEGTPP